MYYSITFRQNAAAKDLTVDKNILVKSQLMKKAAGEGALVTWVGEDLRHLLSCNLFSITADLGTEPKCLDFRSRDGNVLYFASVYRF